MLKAVFRPTFRRPGAIAGGLLPPRFNCDVRSVDRPRQLSVAIAHPQTAAFVAARWQGEVINIAPSSIGAMHKQIISLLVAFKEGATELPLVLISPDVVLSSPLPYLLLSVARDAISVSAYVNGNVHRVSMGSQSELAITNAAVAAWSALALETCPSAPAPVVIPLSTLMRNDRSTDSQPHVLRPVSVIASESKRGSGSPPLGWLSVACIGAALERAVSISQPKSATAMLKQLSVLRTGFPVPTKSSLPRSCIVAAPSASIGWWLTAAVGLAGSRTLPILPPAHPVASVLSRVVSCTSYLQAAALIAALPDGGLGGHATVDSCGRVHSREIHTVSGAFVAGAAGGSAAGTPLEVWMLQTLALSTRVRGRPLPCGGATNFRRAPETISVAEALAVVAGNKDETKAVTDHRSKWLLQCLRGRHGDIDKDLGTNASDFVNKAMLRGSMAAKPSARAARIRRTNDASDPSPAPASPTPAGSAKVLCNALTAVMERKGAGGWATSHCGQELVRSDIARSLAERAKQTTRAMTMIVESDSVVNALASISMPPSIGSVPVKSDNDTRCVSVCSGSSVVLAGVYPPIDHIADLLAVPAVPSGGTLAKPTLVALVGPPDRAVRSLRSRAVGSVPSLRSISLFLCKLFVGAVSAGESSATYLTDVAAAVIRYSNASSGPQDAASSPHDAWPLAPITTSGRCHLGAVRAGTATSKVIPVNLVQLMRELKLGSAIDVLGLISFASSLSDGNITLELPVARPVSKAEASASPHYDRFSDSPHLCTIVGTLNSLNGAAFLTPTAYARVGNVSPQFVAALAVRTHKAMVAVAAGDFVRSCATAWALARSGCPTATLARIALDQVTEPCGECDHCRGVVNKSSALFSGRGRRRATGSLVGGCALGRSRGPRKATPLPAAATAFARWDKRWRTSIPTESPASQVPVVSSRAAAMHAVGVGLSSQIPIGEFGTLRRFALDEVLIAAAANTRHAPTFAARVAAADARYHAVVFRRAIAAAAKSCRALRRAIGPLPLARALLRDK